VAAAAAVDGAGAGVVGVVGVVDVVAVVAVVSDEPAGAAERVSAFPHATAPSTLPIAIVTRTHWTRARLDTAGRAERAGPKLVRSRQPRAVRTASQLA